MVRTVTSPQGNTTEGGQTLANLPSPIPFPAAYKSFGYNAGDANLYRYVGNSPTGATDPTGEFIVFPNEGQAKQFADELTTKYNAKHVATIKGKKGAYVIVDARDRDAVFAYADERFKQIFVKTDFMLDAELKKIAERRNNFLIAAGVAGLDRLDWCNIDGNTVDVDAGDLALVGAAVVKRQADKESHRPLHIDIGGEGRYADAINVNIGAIRGGKPIPRLIARLERDAALPFEGGTVDRITMEATPISQATANEIARLIRAGGTIVLSNPVAVKDMHELVVKAVGGRGSVARDTKEVAKGTFVLTTTIKVKK